MKQGNEIALDQTANFEKPRGSLFFSFNGMTASDIETHGRIKDISYPNGAHYTGECNAQNLKQGKGVFNDGQGNIYEGEFVNDRIEGKGIYKTKEGTVYNGEWKNDLQHGMGKETWPDGSYYLGMYNKGLKDGKGFYKWQDGSEYDGQWVAGNIEGHVD